MKTHYRIPIIVVTLLGLLSAAASADSVVKTLYIDGVQAGQATAEAALTWPYNHIIIGAEGNAGYRYNGYKGKIDEFAIYAGVLDSTRIAAHYNALASGYAAAVSSDNPLLYLRFDDPNTLNPAVSSGSVDITGTYVDGVTLAAGAVGNAAEFHGTGEGGVGDCVDVVDPALAFSLEDVTVELWMYTTGDPNDYPRLFQHNGSWESPMGYGAMLQAGQIGVMGGGTTSYFEAVLNDGAWHHIVITYDSTVDPPTPYTDAVMADNPLAYYRFEDASSANGAVCADSAARAFKNGEYINLNPGTSGIPDIALVAGLERLGTAAQLQGDDGSGNGTCISIFDSWSTEYPTAIAYSEDGSPRQTLTVELWLNSGVSANYPRLLQHNDGGTEGLGIASADGSLTVMGGASTWYTNSANVFNGQWHHIVVTYQPGAAPGQTVEQLYIDGMPAGSNTVTGTLTVPTDFLTIGNNGSKYYVYNAFEGLIDELAFYDTVLSAEQVWTHYSAGTGIVKTYYDEVMADNPVLYLEFNDPANAEDSSANGYYAEYGAGAAVQEAAGIGNAIRVGTSGNSYVAAWKQTTPYTGANDAIGDQYAFTAGDITFEGWFKLSSMETYGLLFQQIRADESKAPGIGNSGGQIRVLNNSGNWWYTGVTMPIDDQWHHFVLTYDEGFEGNAYAMQIQLYLDGERRGQRTVGTSSAPAKLGPELNHLLIGGENDRGNVWNRMNGLVDEFAIYDGILSADRIAVHYNTGLVRLQSQTCRELWIRGEGLAGDINRDCRIDLLDFAQLASTWLVCNDPTLFGTDPACGPTWQ